jgi:hypothetical protein
LAPPTSSSQHCPQFYLGWRRGDWLIALGFAFVAALHLLAAL